MSLNTRTSRQHPPEQTLPAEAGKLRRAARRRELEAVEFRARAEVCDQKYAAYRAGLKS